MTVTVESTEKSNIYDGAIAFLKPAVNRYNLISIVSFSVPHSEMH